MPPPSTVEAAAEFEQLVDLHYRPLYRFAYSLSGSDDAACDLVQQTFFRWAERGHQLRDRSKARSWLYTTLHREFLQLVRRSGRDVPLPGDHEEGGGELAAPEAAWIERLDVDAVYAALTRVEEVFRVPLSLFYFEEFSYADIAGMLGVPIGTVMSRISRGKDRLRRLLVEQPGGAEVLPFPVRKEVRHG